MKERNDNVEVRIYEPALIVEVEAKGDRDAAINAGFRILAGYIFGNNTSKAKISMTTPVAQIQRGEKMAMTTPVSQIGSGDGWRVQFMMPSQYATDSLPKAKDERIQFKTTKAARKVVIRFSGFVSEDNLNRHLTKLRDYVSEHALMVKDAPEYLFYDAPWTLPFMRRNEIAFELI